jgi:8-oxo-dGTP diphosphatase
MFEYDYARPALTVDVIVKRYNDIKNTHQTLLIKRASEPFKDCYALPGGFVNEGETIIQAAIRELKEETNLSLLPSLLQQVFIADTPNRDPRGWTISVVFKCIPILTMEDTLNIIARDDAKEIFWRDDSDLYIKKKKFAFDHFDILMNKE